MFNLLRLFVLALSIMGVVLVRGAYPSHEVPWVAATNAEDLARGVDFIGEMEFCEDMQGTTTKYGYRLRGATTSCGDVNGPVLRMKPNKVYKLTLVNRAQVDTNLHTHGLHVVGAGDSDDPTRIVKPGECLDYVYDLTNHPPGTHWYHPHKKGSVYSQVTGGAHGMIIVEDIPGISPGPGDWATNKDNEILVQVSTYNTNGIEANRNVTEIINIDSNRWYRLRLSMVVPSAQGEEISVPSVANGCKIYKVASDGVWHTTGDFSTFGGQKHYATGVGRADFLLRCGSSSAAFPFGWGTSGTMFTIQPSGGTVNVDGLTDDPKDVGLGTAPTRPSSIVLPPPTTAVYDINNHNGFRIRPSGLRSLDFVNQYDWPANGFAEHLYWDFVQEFTLKGTYTHPFHIHMYHMQIVSDTGCGKNHVRGEFYDTIQQDDDTSDCIVRFATRDFGQKLWVHCHTLGHEDGGMMSYFNVAFPGKMPENNEISPSKVCPAPIVVPGAGPTPTTPAPVPVTPAPVPITPAPVNLTPAPIPPTPVPVQVLPKSNTIEVINGNSFMKKLFMLVGAIPVNTVYDYDAYAVSHGPVKEIHFKAGDTTFHKRIVLTEHDPTNQPIPDGVATIGVFPSGRLWSLQHHNQCEDCKSYTVGDSMALKIEPSVEPGDPIGAYRVYFYKPKDLMFNYLVSNGRSTLWASVWLYEPLAAVSHVAAYTT